jgi:hypothetical protein
MIIAKIPIQLRRSLSSRIQHFFGVKNMIRKTRFVELGYLCEVRGLWRIVDLNTPRINGEAPRIGPHYHSEAELLGDLESYAGRFGCDAAIRPNDPLPPEPDDDTFEPDFDEFLQAYLDCALWSSVDMDTGEALDDYYSTDDFTPEAMQLITDECRSFFDANIGDIRYGCVATNLRFSDSERAGHDFWLTRNGHGAGFWDGDWVEPRAARLTAASKAFGETTILPNDNGKLEIFPS